MLKNTEVVRAYLPNLLARLAEKPPLSTLSRPVRLFDVGCGDWNWMCRVEFFDIVDYVGMDSEEHRPAASAHGPLSRIFLAGDALEDPWPDCDVVLCRHVLQHWTREKVAEFLGKFMSSEATYLIATRHKEALVPDSENFHSYDICTDPFNWPYPIEEIADCEAHLSTWRKFGERHGRPN